MQASPSKARAQAIESHAWSIVLSWLADLFHPDGIPAFERNNTTLKALQAFMTENIAADRVQELLFEAQCEELRIAEDIERERRGGGAGHDAEGIVVELEDSLSDTAKRALDSLASSAVLLGVFPSSINAAQQLLPSRIVSLTRQSTVLEDRIASIKALTSNLETEATQTLHTLSSFRQKTALLSDPENDTNSRPSTPPSRVSENHSGADYSRLHAQTQQHQRESRQLVLKSAEYQTRIEGLGRQLSSLQLTSSETPDVVALVSKQHVLDEKKKRVEMLQAGFTAFHGLPPDVEASRREVRRAEGELDDLKSKRDELFETM